MDECYPVRKELSLSDQHSENQDGSREADFRDVDSTSAGGIEPGFGLRLKGERKRLRRTQVGFGEIGGVGRLAQIQYEQEKSSPTTDYLSRIGAAGVDLSFLLFGIRSSTGIRSEQLGRIELGAFEMVESCAAKRPGGTLSAETRLMLYRVFRNYLIQVELGHLPADATPELVASICAGWQ